MARVGVDTAGRVLVGREEELARLDTFLAGPGARALVLEGEAGTGKTALWEAGIEAARARGLRVLEARPSGAEARLSFAGLTDLLEDVDVSSLTGVPAPQRRALEVALLRVEPTGPRLEPRSIATGLRNVLRELAEAEPLLVAVDDVQWLDRASAEALAFAARRLDDQDIRFLAAKRAGPPSAFESALADETERLPMAPLSLGATRRLLLDRLGLSPPRRVLRQVFETAGGNPLFALELGRVLVSTGTPGIGEDVPVPDAVDDLLGARVAELSPGVRGLVLAVALSSGLSPEQLAALGNPETVEEALEDGVLVVDGGRVRPFHPLVAAAARRRSRARQRRDLHLELAAVVGDEELRARHLALAIDQPDAALADTISAAAAGAAARGARQDAVELAEHALRLTPPGAAERPERVLALARSLESAGERERVTELLSSELDAIPRGALRTDAYMIMTGGLVKDNDEILGLLELALEESRADPELHAAALGEIAVNVAVISVERIPECDAWAREALPAARRAGPEAERRALDAIAWTSSLAGKPIDDVCEQFQQVSAGAYAVEATPERVAAQRLVWRGETEQAREKLARLLVLADEQGEPFSYALVRLHLCELELRLGIWDAAEALLDEWAESSEHLIWPMYERCRALAAAGRGRPEDAERWAAAAISIAHETGVRWDLLEALRARGTACVLAHDHDRAAESLRTVWEHTQREGVGDPGTFPAAPELVEVLVELGAADEALAVAERVSVLADELDHPWGRATAKRCRGLVHFAADTYDDAAAALEEAAAAYEKLGLRFDQARTLLALGRGERRLRKWGAARCTLERATSLFDELGSPGWADEARSELARVGARKPQAPGGLTRTEARVAELAAQGLSNKEIASTLFVTVHTVEVHLSHTYAKLGIRSRSQLAARL